jgi:DNA-binding HxlR family transcriptional regulator
MRRTLLIIRDALLGLRRFDEFQRNLGIARKVLAERLRCWSTKESSNGFAIKNGRSGTSTT